MSLRQRPASAGATTAMAAPADGAVPDSPNSRSSQSFSQRALEQTLTSTAQLANLLPTGTLLVLQILGPIFTNHGACDAATRPLTAILLSALAAGCFLASFTDSFKSSDGRVFYGFATFEGMLLFDYDGAVSAGSLPDLRKYRLRFIDWVHAVVSALVVVVLALRDKNVTTCFYPSPSHEAQEVLDIVPLGLGLVCSFLFVLFPTKRHGIGYPVTH